LPAEHIVDSGYVDAAQVVTSRDTDSIDVVGPAPGDQSRHARAAAGFDVAHFALDGDAERATCPTGHTSVKWQPTHDQRGQPIITSAFARADCRACPRRASCTHSTDAPRWLTVRPRAQHDALQAARQRQTTTAFKEHDAARRDRVSPATIFWLCATPDIAGEFIGTAKVPELARPSGPLPSSLIALKRP